MRAIESLTGADRLAIAGITEATVAAALHEQGIGCKPNTLHCRSSHRGHAGRILAALATPVTPEGGER